MNSIYRVLWNDIRRTCTVVSENTSRGKRSSLKASVVATVAALSVFAAGPAAAWMITGGSTIDGVSSTVDHYASGDLNVYAGECVTESGSVGSVAIDVSVTSDGSTAADRLYGLDLEGKLDNFIDYTIADTLTIAAEAPSNLGGLRGLRNVNGYLTVNGITSINVKHTSGGSSYSTAMDTQQGSTTFNGNADIRIDGYAGGGWINAVQLFGGEVNFNGAETVLFAQNEKYTAQTVVFNPGDYGNNDKRPGAINFNGGNVSLYARSPYGVNGLGYNNIANNAATFNNTGTALISVAILGNGIGTSNAVGNLGNSSILNVTEEVDEFKIEVLGSGRFNGNSGNSNGTAGMSNYGSETRINAKKFSINVVAGQNYSTSDVEDKQVDVLFDKEFADTVEYASTYGIENAVSYFEVGKDTDTIVNVDDDYWNAVGVLNSVAYRQNDNKYLSGDTELKFLGNVDIAVSGASHTATGSQNQFGERVSYTAALSSGTTFAGAENDLGDKYRSAVTLGSAGKTVKLHAENLSTAGGLTDLVYGVKADHSDILFDGEQTAITVESLTGQKYFGVYAEKGTQITFGAQNTTICTSGTAGTGSWGYGIDVKTNSAVTFTGGNVEINTAAEKYTAQTLTVRDGSTTTFSNTGNTLVRADSPFGATAIVLKSDNNASNGGTLLVNGTGNFTASAGNLQDGVYDASAEFTTNAVALLLENGAFEIGSGIKTATFDVYGQGTDFDGSTFSDGTTAVFLQNEDASFKVSSDSLVVTAEAIAEGSSEDKLNAYGLRTSIDGGKIDVASRTSSIISVTESRGTAWGILLEGGVASLAGAVTLNASGNTGAIAVEVGEGAQLSLGSSGKIVTVTATASQEEPSKGIVIAENALVTTAGITSVTADQALWGDGKLSNEGDLTLNGSISDFTGLIENAGSITLGSEKFSNFKGSYAQTGGEQIFTDVTGYLAGTVNLQGGIVNVSGLTLGTDALSNTTLSGGSIAVTAEQAFGTGESAEYTGLGGLKEEKGAIVLTDDSYTFKFAQNANASLHADDANADVELVYLGTVSNMPDSGLKLKDIAGTGVHAGTDVSVSSNVVIGGDAPQGAHDYDSAANNVGVRSIDMTGVEDETASVTIKGGKSLTLVGSSENSQQLISKQETVNLTVMVGDNSEEGVLKLGQGGVASGGTLDATVDLNRGTVAVANGKFNVNEIKVSEMAQDVSLEITDAELGTKLLGNANLSIKVGSDGAVGTLHLMEDSKLNGAFVFISPDGKTEIADSIEDASLCTWAANNVDGKLVAGRSSAVVLGTNDATALSSTIGGMGLSWGATGYTAAAYLAGPITISEDGALVVDGELSEASGVEGHKITFAANSLLVADMAKVEDNGTLLTLADSDTGSVSIDKTSTAVLLNVSEGATYTLVSGNAFWTDVRSANPIFELTVNDTTGVVTVNRQNASSVYGSLLQGDLLVDAAMAKSGSDEYEYVNSILGRLDGDKALSAATFDAAMNPAGSLGVFSTALDRADEMKSALRAEVGGSDESSRLWITLTGGRTDIDGLSTGGQSLDLKTEHAGFVMGAQSSVEGTRVGLLFAAGTGSTRNNAVAAKDEFANYGVALYAQRDFGSVTFTADASVTFLKSDLSVGGAAQVQTETTTNVYGLGLEAKRDFSIGTAVLTPFIGADIYHVRGADLVTAYGASTESANASLLQIPVGVRARTEWTGASGITFRPAFGFAVVPALGSKDIDQITHYAGASESYSFTFADDVRVRTNFNFTAESESMRLGIALGYDWGDEERSSLAAQAHVDFLF